MNVQGKCYPFARPVETVAALTCGLLVLLSLSASAAAAINVAVEQPWMRFTIKSRPAAGYFTLKNNGDAPVTLVGAASPDCGMLMLHQSKEVKGVEKMLPVKSITVQANGIEKFQPGGYHLMCMAPKPALHVGATVPVTLKFVGGDEVTAQFPVKSAK
jgi:periplasmic copper chaperone A